MEKKQNVPALRFQGFSGEWEKYNLSMLSGVITKGTTPLDKSGKGDVNFIKIENIDANTGAIHVTQKISQEEHNGYLKRSQLKENDILFSIAGTLGRVAVVKANLLPANTNQALAIIRLKKGNFQYVKTYLQGKAVENFLKANPTVGAQPNLSLAQVGDLEVVMPEESKEQENISDFFQYWDELIFHTMAKIKRLRQFRQAMLTKLFPREGAAEPELRFRGFSGKWKCCRFGDIADIRRGLTYSPSSLRKSGIRVLRASNIQDDTFYIREDDVFVEPDAVNIPMVKNGDILIAAAGGSTRLVGKHAVIYGIEENSVAHGGFMLLASSDYPEFTNALMGANWYRHFVQQFIAGGNGAIGNLNKSDLEEQIVFVPDVAEMEQIGNFFKELDTYISLQQKKLERMQRLKAALLEKLFV